MSMQPFDQAPTHAHRELSLINTVTDSWIEVLEDVAFLAGKIAATEFVPQGLRGSVPKVVAAVMHGRELGLPPMTALAGSNVINGRPGISAELMRALIAQHGHDFRIVSMSDTKVEIRCRRAEWEAGAWSTFVFTMDDAAKRGLTQPRIKDGKTTPSMFLKFPAEMLLARVTTRAARAVFADVLHGMRSIEELDDIADDVFDPGIVAPGASTSPVSRQQATPGGVAAAEGSTGSGGAVVEPGAAPNGPGAVPTEKAPPRQRAQTRRDRAAQAAAAPVADDSTQEQPSVPQIADSDIDDERARLDRMRENRDHPVEAAQQLDETAVDRETGEVLDDGIVDAELVEPSQLAADDGSPDPLAVDDPAAAAELRPQAGKTIAAIIMHFGRLGVTERDERLFWTGHLAGRVVTSSNELSTTELRTVESKLGRLRNQAALDALLKTKGDESK
ncbi:MAG: hypothetical protein IPJ61_20610 [Tessaracoccus sp.]|uniref:hypothetical protein n=1 Tax=Tessaracoccus sp. TaxID=1971211 RepID=UPI001EB9F28F|nr:hypothetical protein [Tessaracoccus sp.]MBK7823391.1 hypothetical protein [Tessaracoccus sp.]